MKLHNSNPQVERAAKALGYKNQMLADIVDGWKDLMEIFYQQSWVCNPKLREEDPNKFWTYVLQNFGEGMEEPIKTFIRHILIIPASSGIIHIYIYMYKIRNILNQLSNPFCHN